MTTNPAVDKLGLATVASNRSEVGSTTLSGTIKKSLLLLLTLVIVAPLASSWLAVWSKTHHGHAAFVSANRAFACSFFGAIALVGATLWKPRMATATGPLFAVTEGIALGMISMVFSARFPGLVLPILELSVVAIALLFVVCWMASRPIWSSFTEKLSPAVSGAIAYCLSALVLRVGRIHAAPLPGSGMRSFLMSTAVLSVPVIALLASWNTAVRRVRERDPKYMEWYAALRIVACIAWIYCQLIGMILAKTHRLHS